MFRVKRARQERSRRLEPSEARGSEPQYTHITIRMGGPLKASANLSCVFLNPNTGLIKAAMQRQKPPHQKLCPPPLPLSSGWDKTKVTNVALYSTHQYVSQRWSKLKEIRWPSKLHCTSSSTPPPLPIKSGRASSPPNPT